MLDFLKNPLCDHEYGEIIFIVSFFLVNLFQILLAKSDSDQDSYFKFWFK